LSTDSAPAGASNAAASVVVQHVQVLATALPTAANHDGATDPDTDQPYPDGRLAILGTIPQQAELTRFAQLDGTSSLLLRSHQDAAPADVTTTWVIHRRVVDERGSLPPRVVLTQYP
jgi:Flp pilus assembly protein CpaB